MMLTHTCQIITHERHATYIPPQTAIITSQTYRSVFSIRDAVIVSQIYRGECPRKIIRRSMFARKIVSINCNRTKNGARVCKYCISLLMPGRRQRGQLHYRLQKTALRAAGRGLTFTSGPTLIEFNAPSYNDNLFFCVSRVCVRRRDRRKK